MSASFQVFCRGESYLCFAVAVLPALSTLNEIKNDGKPVRNVVRTRKATSIPTEIKIPTDLLQNSCASYLLPCKQPCNHNPHHNHNHYKTTPTSTLTPRTTKQLGREHCRDKYGHWPKRGGNVGHLSIHGGKWTPAAKLGKHPRAWRFLLHTLPDVCTSTLPGGASVLLFFHHIHASASSDCHFLSQTPPVFVFLKFHNHTWFDKVMGIIQLPSAKLRSIMAKSNLVWDSEAISKTYQGAFLVLQTSRLQLVPYSPVWGAPRIFGGLEFPALPPAKWNSLVQNHPAFLRFQKVQLDDWVKLSSYTWWLSHYTSSHGSVEKWERHPIWVSFHLGWIFHSTMIMGERVSCFLPWITSQNLQGLDSGSQKNHGKNMMFREVAPLLPLKILPKPNRPNTNITQITVQGSMFQRRYVRFKMLQTFRLHLPSLDSTSPITVHLPMQRNQLTRSLWSNTKKRRRISVWQEMPVLVTNTRSVSRLLHDFVFLQLCPELLRLQHQSLQLLLRHLARRDIHRSMGYLVTDIIFLSKKSTLEYLEH